MTVKMMDNKITSHTKSYWRADRRRRTERVKDEKLDSGLRWDKGMERMRGF